MTDFLTRSLAIWPDGLKADHQRTSIGYSYNGVCEVRSSYLLIVLVGARRILRKITLPSFSDLAYHQKSLTILSCLFDANSSLISYFIAFEFFYNNLVGDSGLVIFFYSVVGPKNNYYDMLWFFFDCRCLFASFQVDQTWSMWCFNFGYKRCAFTPTSWLFA